MTETITHNLKIIKNSLPEHVTLVAVSKTKPIEDIQKAYNAGQRVFGENKAQEMTDKAGQMPKDIKWHMIGHMQTNKVKYIAPYVALIHSVDSDKLLKEINKQALKNNRVIDVLLQVHIADEETKFGWNEEELEKYLNLKIYTSYSNIRIVGIMGMATFTDNEQQVKSEFAHLKTIFNRFQKQYSEIPFKELSMGMSGDYSLAIEEGSTMVRIGSSIFGERNYNI